MSENNLHKFRLERLSIDLSNYCSKACDFCYNHSSLKGPTEWKPDEVILMALDCAKNGLKAISLGGGEPFEYDGIFKIISALTPDLFVSVTSNGLPLLNPDTFQLLSQNKPDKIHLTIHRPDDEDEWKRTIFLLNRIKKLDIKTGINIFVSADKIAAAKILTQNLYQYGIKPGQIIFVPRKYNLIPTAGQVAEVSGMHYFQSAACLTKCERSSRFCSVSWDKQVSYCSYSPGKASLNEYTYKALLQALENVNFINCFQ